MHKLQPTRLEDFGALRAPTAEERLEEYRRQDRGLPPKLQAKFWRTVLSNDSEVRKLTKAGPEPACNQERRRHRKWKRKRKS